MILRMHSPPDTSQRIADICRRYGVRRLQMFGSAAEGTEGPDSDSGRSGLSGGAGRSHRHAT